MLKTKVTKKIIIGIMVVACIVTVVSVANTNFVSAEEYDADPGDPGNSPGPGIDPTIGAIIEDIPFEFSFDISTNQLISL